MDIQNLKYNRELIKTKTRLEKELKMVATELESQQGTCNHIAVYLGTQNHVENICRCLLCREKYTTADIKQPFVNAWDYKISLLGRLDEDIVLNILQQQCIEISEENPALKQEEMIEELNKYLLKEQNKVIQARSNIFNRRKD